jgi:hypothetical protein
MADRGGRPGPYVAAVTAEPEPDRTSTEFSPAWPLWVRPIAEYERKETTIVKGLRYG